MILTSLLIVILSKIMVDWSANTDTVYSVKLIIDAFNEIKNIYFIN